LESLGITLGIMGVIPPLHGGVKFKKAGDRRVLLEQTETKKETEKKTKKTPSIGKSRNPGGELGGKTEIRGKLS